MNKLYNKILKETLDIMNFDSWDESIDQEFKETIKKQLTSPLKTQLKLNMETLQDASYIVETAQMMSDELINGKFLELLQRFCNWLNKVKPEEKWLFDSQGFQFFIVTCFSKSIIIDLPKDIDLADFLIPQSLKQDFCYKCAWGNLKNAILPKGFYSAFTNSEGNSPYYCIILPWIIAVSNTYYYMNLQYSGRSFINHLLGFEFYFNLDHPWDKDSKGFKDVLNILYSCKYILNKCTCSEDWDDWFSFNAVKGNHLDLLNRWITETY